MDWNDLRYFLAIADAGSTLAGGRRLGVSQTTVARRVTALEMALNMPLFERRSSGYRLTEQGRALVPFALDFERTAERLVEAAAASVRDASGTVRVTVAEIYGVTLVAPILHELRDAHPRIRIELDTSEEIRDLAEGAADIAIRVCVRPVGAGLFARQVNTDSWGIYCSRAYAAEHGRPRRRSDLAGHTFIGGGEPGIRKYYEAWLDRNRLGAAVAMNHNTSLGILASVRAGSGIAALPSLVADSEPDLLRCLPPDQDNIRGLWLIAHESARKVPRVRATLDFLGDRLSRLRHANSPATLKAT
jgi:DNA-binding transcriptional LysR family regulator